MAKIYVASSWRNSYQQNVVSFLRNEGHEVYDFTHPNGDMSYSFSWSSIDLNWKNWSTQQYREALNHPIAQKGFDLDFNAMKWADVCVMVLPCGRSANTEAGWMKGAGKRVMVYSPKYEEPELMYKLYDFISDSMLRINEEINRIYNEDNKGKQEENVLSDNQWIDINEQCPEDDQLVLARVDNGRITLARAWVIETENSLSVKWTAEYIPLFGEYYITHWMPIPEFKTK